MSTSPITRALSDANSHSRSAAEVLSILGSDAQLGLTESKVQQRQTQFGANALAETSAVPLWRQFLAQLQEIVVGLLLVAAVIAALLGEWIDTGAILAIVVVNAALGVFQQRKAEHALSELQKLSAPTAKVLRDGQLRNVAARELVPGDRIEVEAGDHVPADARLVHGFGLQSLESALTGESTPIAKDTAAVLAPDTPLGDRRNMLFQGSVIATGKAGAVVVATGMDTELGRIAQLLARQSTEPTPLQRRLAALGRGLVLLCVALVGVIFALQLARGGQFLETLHLAVSLAVAAIPEGLPAAVTITLAVGLERLVRRNAIIRKLASVETLGSVNVICSDKTGTLTRNEMTVREVHTSAAGYAVAGAGYGPHGEFSCLQTARPIAPKNQVDLLRILEVTAWCNHARVVPAPGAGDRWNVMGDPTEAALVVLARKAGLETSGRGELLYEIPFDSDRKAMSVVVAPPGRPRLICLKGAPEVVLDKCIGMQRNGQTIPLTAADRTQLLAITEARVVAFCILAFAQLGYSLSCRSWRVSFLELGLASNRTLLAAIGVSFMLQIGIVLIPFLHPVFGIEAYPTGSEWLVIVGLSCAPMFCVELSKRSLGRRDPGHEKWRQSEQVHMRHGPQNPGVERP